MNNKFWNAPAWSLGNRFKGKQDTQVQGPSIPGPGTYDLQHNTNKAGCKIGSEKRGVSNSENQPGPGNYDIMDRNFGPKISMGSKFNNNGRPPNANTPGPGNYNTSTMSRPGSGVTMGAKYDLVLSKKLNQQPGPGAYNLGDNKKGGVKIGTSKRTVMNGKVQNPGPGEYTCDKRPYSAGPKYGFGKAEKKRDQLWNNAPGPGQYDLNSFVKNGQSMGCTMGQRFKKGADLAGLGPGPGYYDGEGNLNRQSSGVKIGKAKRGAIDSPFTPGPGAYDTNLKSAQGATIGKGNRRDFGKLETPGPGAYDPMKDDKAGITIAGNRGKTKMEDVPGPGAYNPDDYSRNRPCSANIGRSLRTSGQQQETPGPGQYYHNEFNKYKFAYTKELRSKDLKKGDPGPGQYQIPPSVPSAPYYLIDPNIYKSYGSRS